MWLLCFTLHTCNHQVWGLCMSLSNMLCRWLSGSVVWQYDVHLYMYVHMYMFMYMYILTLNYQKYSHSFEYITFNRTTETRYSRNITLWWLIAWTTSIGRLSRSNCVRNMWPNCPLVCLYLPCSPHHQLVIHPRLEMTFNTLPLEQNGWHYAKDIFNARYFCRPIGICWRLFLASDWQWISIE